MYKKNYSRMKLTELKNLLITNNTNYDKDELDKLKRDEIIKLIKNNN